MHFYVIHSLNILVAVYKNLNAVTIFSVAINFLVSLYYMVAQKTNKEDKSVHQKNLTKLCRISRNMVGKKKYEVKKYTDSTDNYFYINSLGARGGLGHEQMNLMVFGQFRYAE